MSDSFGMMPPAVTATSGSEGDQTSPISSAAATPVKVTTTSLVSAAAAAAPSSVVMSSIGRIKAPPSAGASMKRQGVSSCDLNKLCFSPDEAAAVGSGGATANGGEGSKQSTAAGEVTAGSAAAAAAATETSSSSAASNSGHGDTNKAGGANGRNNIGSRTVSRNGRETQRWATDPTTGQPIRLTTGCVPIMRDGQILLCSSSRKEAWILPKGGWESDETLEESALRETFEEAGVLGTLGPVLSEIEYETRKAKKRRLERESLMKIMIEEQHAAEQQRRASSTGTGGGTCASLDEVDEQAQEPQPQPSEPPLPAAATEDVVVNGTGQSSVASDCSDNKRHCGSMSPPPAPPPPPMANSPPPAPPPPTTANSSNTDTSTNNPVFKIQEQVQQQLAGIGKSQHSHDDATSVASSVASMASDASTTCTHARMRLFPMYVSEVREEWPESGRARKVLDIDSAIALMESRPEFHKALVEVKERGLHLVNGEQKCQEERS